MSPRLGKGRGWAAVFFGDAAIEVTTARAAGNELNVVLQTSEPLAAELDGQTEDARLQVTAQTLRQRIDLHEHHIVTAISCEDVLCQTLRLPTTSPSELQQMLDLQIDNLTPFPVEEVVYSFEALETTGTETRVLVAVARKAAVNGRVAALEAVGWQTERVSIDGLAVFRGLVRTGVLPNDAKLHTLLLISPAAVNIIAFSAGQVVVVRSLMLGTTGLGEVATQQAVQEELARTQVAAEVERPGLAAGRVVLATWSEAMRSKVTELADLWGGTAEVLANGSSPSPAMSVCLETARAGERHLNLLPDEWLKRRREAQVRRLMIRGGIALAVLYVMLLAAFLTVIGIKKAQLRGVESDLKQHQGQFNQARELQKTLAAMEKQLDTKYSALETLREISQLLPENVKLSAFAFKKDDTVVLRAQAQAAGMVHEFEGRLEKSPLFSKTPPGQERTEAATGLTKFDVTCTLKSAAAP